MKHLLPTTDIQSIKIIPRVYSTSVSMELRDDSTNTTVSITPTAQKVGNYIELSNVFNLKEGRFYDLKVIDTNTQNIIYKDKIFCTAQSTNQSNNESYSVNKDEYKSKSGNNDFIILWVNK